MIIKLYNTINLHDTGTYWAIQKNYFRWLLRTINLKFFVIHFFCMKKNRVEIFSYYENNFTQIFLALIFLHVIDRVAAHAYSMKELARDCCTWGYHKYEEIWVAQIGEILMCERETENSFDWYPVVVKKKNHYHRYLLRGLLLVLLITFSTSLLAKAMEREDTNQCSAIHEDQEDHSLAWSRLRLTSSWLHVWQLYFTRQYFILY